MTGSGRIRTNNILPVYIYSVLYSNCSAQEHRPSNYQDHRTLNILIHRPTPCDQARLESVRKTQTRDEGDKVGKGTSPSVGGTTLLALYNVDASCFSPVRHSSISPSFLFSSLLLFSCSLPLSLSLRSFPSIPYPSEDLLKSSSRTTTFFHSPSPRPDASCPRPRFFWLAQVVRLAAPSPTVSLRIPSL